MMEVMNMVHLRRIKVWVLQSFNLHVKWMNIELKLEIPKDQSKSDNLSNMLEQEANNEGCHSPNFHADWKELLKELLSPEGNWSFNILSLELKKLLVWLQKLSLKAFHLGNEVNIFNRSLNRWSRSSDTGTDNSGLSSDWC